MKTSDFDYPLPPEFIAQTPITPRDAARLLVVDRADGSLTHTDFHQIGRYLNRGDLLVLNRTRVIPARLFARKIPTGGRVELLLLRRLQERTWEALVGGKKMGLGLRLALDSGLEAEITAVLDGARREVRFSRPLSFHLERLGHVPLPPYIQTPLEDPERYQTVFAQTPGSAAAPTAGLHFTPELLKNLEDQGVGITEITLHIGLDTFAPVTEAEPHEHTIHTEWCQMTADAAAAVNHTRQGGGRIVAVGTTCVRVLESAASQAAPEEVVGVLEGPTDLFILPGHQFRAVDAMVTNFHLPRSTLLMLVSAFWDREHVLETYRVAQEKGYRFYSFGDAMLIL